MNAEPALGVIQESDFQLQLPLQPIRRILRGDPLLIGEFVVQRIGSHLLYVPQGVHVVDFQLHRPEFQYPSFAHVETIGRPVPGVKGYFQKIRDLFLTRPRALHRPLELQQS